MVILNVHYVLPEEHNADLSPSHLSPSGDAFFIFIRGVASTAILN